MSKKMLCLAILLSAALSAQAAQRPGVKYAPAGTPTRAIQDVDDRLEEFRSAPRGKKLSAEDEAFNRQLKKDIINGTFDARELSRLALGDHWNKLTAKQQDEFVDVMVSLLEERALFSREQSASRSKDGGKYRVLYRNESFITPEKDRALVRTTVLVPSENIDIALNYKLKKMNGQWKVYDIVVDDASLVSNYRYQFNSIITKNGYDELVRRMSNKLDSFRAKRSQPVSAAQ